MGLGLDSLSDWIAFVLSNFDMVMFDVAIIFIIIHALIARKNQTESEVVYRWMALFAVGFTGIFAFIMHIFFPETSANNIGWAQSPFQVEVGVANLAIGILAMLSFKARYPFRLATVIVATIWLWGAALGHLYQLIEYQNYSVGNAGSWFWMDMLIPIILILCIIKLKPDTVKKVR